MWFYNGSLSWDGWQWKRFSWISWLPAEFWWPWDIGSLPESWYTGAHQFAGHFFSKIRYAGLIWVLNKLFVCKLLCFSSKAERKKKVDCSFVQLYLNLKGILFEEHVSCRCSEPYFWRSLFSEKYGAVIYVCISPHVVCLLGWIGF